MHKFKKKFEAYFLNFHTDTILIFLTEILKQDL